MSGKPPISNKKNYREEGKRIKALAAEVKDERAREQLLLIASLYEKLSRLEASYRSIDSQKSADSD